MHRTLTFFAAAAILFSAGPAFADAGGPYKMDAKGKCHDAKGGFAAVARCKAPVPSSGGKCRDAKTKKFVKCGAPGSEPVPATTTKSTTTKSTTKKK